jgi:hypothetical protein
VFFRGPLFSGFRRLTGNTGDWVLAVFLSEHWRLTLSGAAQWPWWQPPYIAPAQGTLAFTDPHFGFVLPYAALRAAGLDAFLSFQLSVMAFSLAGFLAFVALARRVAGAGFGLALLGAAGFTFSNMNYIKLGHPVHATAPLLALLVLLYARALEALSSSPVRANLLGLTGALLFGFLLMTAFQVAWYGALIALTTTLVLVALRPGAVWSAVRATGTGRFATFLAIQLTSLAAAVSPFLSVFAASWLAGDERPYWAVLYYAPRPLDAFNVGTGNLLWGRLVHLLGNTQEGEFMLAQTPIVAAVFLILLFSAWRDRRSAAPDMRMRAILAGGIAAVLLAPLAFKIGSVSGWWLLREAVPGARAIRTPYRIQLALALPLWLVIVAGAGVSWRKLAERCANAPRLRQALAAGIALLGVLMLAEQINLLDQTGLDRSDERARFARIPAAAPECRTFFVTSTESQRDALALHTDAMMVAVRDRIPTLNGDSGTWPPQWQLNDVHAPDYLENVARWARFNHLNAGLCRLDLPDGVWSAWTPPG